jgi:hypothetical protein
MQGFFPFGCAQGQNDDVKQRQTAKPIATADSLWDDKQKVKCESNSEVD